MNNIKIEYNQYTEIDCSKIKGFEIDNSMAKDIIHISMYTFYFGLNAVTAFASDYYYNYCEMSSTNVLSNTKKN